MYTERGIMQYISLLKEPFWYGETNLCQFSDYPCRINGGGVFLCTSGNATITTGLLENVIEQNAEMIILPGTTLCMVSASENFSVRAFSFSKDLYDKVSLRLGTSFAQYLRDAPIYVYQEEELLANAHTWMNMAELIYKHENDFTVLMQQNFLQNYLLYLFHWCKSHIEQRVGRYTRKQERFHQFLSLLDIYCQEHRDVAFYADKLCVTPRYLRLITNECSSFESPKEIIDKRFILEIKVLLQSTELTIQEIAEKLHFPDLSYFGRFFKRHTGLSATEYRKNKFIP